MIGVAIDYASPSVFESNRERALLGLAACVRRPVRFHGRLTRNIPLVRFALRALGEAIWSDDAWMTAGERLHRVLDPVITVHPDQLLFEAFSQDQSTYATLALSPDLFEPEGELVTGTTNVDFTAWLWGALNELRSSRETWFRIEAAGFEVATPMAGGRFEEKVDLPESWVRGFLQVSSAMAMPGTKLTLRPVDLLAAIRFLRYTKAKLSPRALRYELEPGQTAQLVLEPWEHRILLHGCDHSHTTRKVVRTWGRRRLSLIEPLLPFATSVEVHLKGRGLPSFYVVKLPGLTFTLGLSGWTGQSWTDAAGLDLLAPPTATEAELLDRIREQLGTRLIQSARELSERLDRPLETIWRHCEKLCRQGRAVFDLERYAFRQRELFEEPADEAKLFPPDVRLENAEQLLMEDRVVVASCEPETTLKLRKLKTPEGPVTREIIHRDWRVMGSAGTEAKVEIVLGDSGRILFGTCGCAFFRDHILSKGPCEHMIALWRKSDSLRQDLPTSQSVGGSDRSSTDPDDASGDEGEPTEDGR